MLVKKLLVVAMEVGLKRGKDLLKIRIKTWYLNESGS